MNSYIPEEYTRAIESLEPIIEKYGLDYVTISSIVRGCLDIEEQIIPPASKIWTSKDGNVYSIKPSNIKVNLSFALGNAFRLKRVFTQEDIWLVLAIIHLIVDIFTSATKKVDEISALVLLAIFRLQSAEKERIYEYAKKIVPEHSVIELTEEQFSNALDNLEELKCIHLKDGKYSICETIDSSFFG